MRNAVSFIAATAGSLLSAAVLIMYFLFRNGYRDIEAIADGRYILCPPLLFLGCGMIAAFGRKKKKERGGLERLKNMYGELCGRDNSSFMLYCFRASSLSLFSLLLPSGLLLAALSREPFLVIPALILPAFPCLYMYFEAKRQSSARRAEILSELPSVTSLLTLLISAGSVLREAWEITSRSSEGPLCLQMRTAAEKMKNGMPECDALYIFSQECGVKEARQLASLLIQNIEKGSDGLSRSLRIMNDECWAEKKHRAVVKGKTAESKLMIPLMMMFIGVLIMIVVPLFTNII